MEMVLELCADEIVINGIGNCRMSTENKIKNKIKTEVAGCSTRHPDPLTCFKPRPHSKLRRGKLEKELGFYYRREVTCLLGLSSGSPDDNPTT